MNQRLPWFVFWPRGDRPVRWIPERERPARLIVVWAFMVGLAFAARWFFGPDTVGAFATVGLGIVVVLVVAFWWNARTGEHVTPVELHRRNAMITLRAPLWRQVGFHLLQTAAAVAMTLAVTIEDDLDGRMVSIVAPILLFALLILIPVFVLMSLWERRLATKLLARTQAD